MNKKEHAKINRIIELLGYMESSSHVLGHWFSDMLEEKNSKNIKSDLIIRLINDVKEFADKILLQLKK